MYITVASESIIMNDSYFWNANVDNALSTNIVHTEVLLNLLVQYTMYC
jgi:hypothetical protein